MDLAGKVAIVTGGASGLGRATVEAYVAKGVKVAIFDMNEDKANEVIDELGADNVAFWNVNVADEDSVKAAVEGVVEKFGAIHVCNNYAGIGNACKTYGKKGVFPLDQYMLVININLVGTFNVSRYAAEQMSKNDPINDDGGRGVIINTASVAGLMAGCEAYSLPNAAPYGTAKHGIIGLTRHAAVAYAKDGIRINAIAPGAHLTWPISFPREEMEKLNEHMSGFIPMGRAGDPKEIRGLAVYLASDASSYVTGHTIVQDGGFIA